MYPRLLSPLGPPWTPGKPATAVFVAKKCCHLVAQSQSYQYPHTLLTFLPPVHSSEMKGCGVRHGGESLKPPVPFEFGSLEWDQLSHGISPPTGSPLSRDQPSHGISHPSGSVLPLDHPSYKINAPTGSAPMGLTPACKNSRGEHGLFG